MASNIGHFYEFGEFRLDATKQRLTRNGEIIPLPPKAIDTLLVLVQNPGRLLEREELMQAVWPDIFVEDANLTVTISNLRKALRQDADHAKYIETIPRIGYRFVAEVTSFDDHTAPLVMEKHTISKTVIEEDFIADSEDSVGANNVLDIEPTKSELTAQAVQPYLRDLPFEKRTRERLIIVEEEVKPDLEISRTIRSQTAVGKRMFGQWSRRAALSLSVLAMSLIGALGLLIYLRSVDRKRPQPAGAIKSIAVLPFRVINAESGSEHIGLGVADLLITRLSNIAELNVRPTSAIFAFDQLPQGAVSAGQQLQVDAVLEGTIYRAAGRLRVTARLLNVNDGSPLWAGQFENSLQDELRVQDQISLQLVEALALSLSDNEKKTLTKRYTQSVNAYQLYIKGRYHWNRRSVEAMLEAERLFRKAIEEDSHFALAYVGLVDTLVMRQPLIMDDLTDERIRYLNKALDLDPLMAEAYATLGFIKMFHQWEWKKAEAAFKRSIELNSGYATAHHWYATLLAIEGRNDEAKAEMLRALEIDPLSYNFLTDMGEAHYFAREYEQAEEYCHKALEIYPDFIGARNLLSKIYLQRGEHERSFEMIVKSSEAYGASGSLTSDEKAALERHFKALFKQVGPKRYVTETLFRQPETNPYLYLEKARYYAHFGEKEKAIDHLEEAYHQRVFLVAFIKADPTFDSLRSDPRYISLLGRMGLETKL